jgi:hypothetical protein
MLQCCKIELCSSSSDSSSGSSSAGSSTTVWREVVVLLQLLLRLWETSDACVCYSASAAAATVGDEWCVQCCD